MDYQQSREYLRQAQTYGSVLGLDNMREMMKRLGNPQDQLKYIHVAGTNGKGSVLAYLSSVLAQTGYRVGRYVSPAIFSYREQFEINQKPISREAFARCLSKVAQVADSMEKEGKPHPTPFEMETATAFFYFAEENCDLVLLETGMGGLTDATNIIRTTEVAVLTSISMDHMAFLGNTLGEIAACKAGIIKEGCRVVAAEQKPEAMEKIRKACERFHIIPVVSSSEEGRVTENEMDHMTFEYGGRSYTIPLTGACQMENVMVALHTLEVLIQNGYNITPAQIEKGLENTQWKGRFTALLSEPLLIADGAHNPDAAGKLVQSLKMYFQGKDLYFIIGMFRDKDYESVLKMTAPLAKEIMTIQTSGNPRALPAEELAQAARKYHSHVEPAKSIEEAVEKMTEKAEKEGVVVAFGSLSFMRELAEAIEKRKDNAEK